MNTETRRFRHIGTKSGAFVIVAALIAIAVLLLAARAQWWFASSRSYVVRLPDDGTGGLRSGSAIEVLGAQAGYVNRVEIGDDGSLTAGIAVREDFARFVTADSVCTVRKKTLDIGGDAYLVITRGTGPALPAGAQLICRSEHDVLASLAEVASGLSAELKPALAEIRAAAHEYAALARTIRDPDGSLQHLITRLDELAQKANEGKGVAGRILTDQTWATEVDASLHSLHSAIERADAVAEQMGGTAKTAGDQANALLARLNDGEKGLPAALADLRSLLADLRPIVTDLGKAVAMLPEMAATARNEVRGLPGMVERSQVLLGELEKVVLAAQRHWLLRGYIEPAPPTRRLGTEGLGEGR
jgi:ABC-type transporter Mla subunit MlaD